MLRKIRISLAALFLSGITLLFIGIGQNWLGWMAKLQLYPAILRVVGGATLGNIAVLSALLALACLFGRIYCSVICPLGIFQDTLIWLRRKAGRKQFSYSPEKKIPRNAVLAISILLTVLGCQLVVAAIAPYSAYGRMVSAIVAGIGGTLTAALLVTAAATFIAVSACAILWGRAWCNNICPVGTLLGHISRYSLFKVRIDTEKCRNCGSCGRKCKASCIDTSAHSIDYSRCVVCFDCIGSCSFDAISYVAGHGKKASETEAGEEKGNGRRKFLGTTAALAGSLVAAKAQDMKLDGGLAALVDRREPERRERLVPFGSDGVKSFYDHCTSCQLCISACPNDVLHPSTDLEHLLQPVMSYTGGWCRPECNACADVCPSGAIRPLHKEEKLGIKIGTARVNQELCLAAKGEETCGNCVRHCPVGAVKMVIPEGQNLRRPVVMEDICTGCGACEYLCPARPVSAITVDGVSIHHKK